MLYLTSVSCKYALFNHVMNSLTHPIPMFLCYSCISRPLWIRKLFGLVTYLDWIMIMMTIMSCTSMFFETPHRRLTNTTELKVHSIIVILLIDLLFDLFKPLNFCHWFVLKKSNAKKKRK